MISNILNIHIALSWSFFWSVIFQPECKVSDDMRFTAYNQYVHRMLHRWGPNVKEMMAIKKYLATQSITLTQPPWVKLHFPLCIAEVFKVQYLFPTAFTDWRNGGWFAAFISNGSKFGWIERGYREKEVAESGGWHEDTKICAGSCY